MQFSISYDELEFDSASYTRALGLYIEEQMKQAAVRFANSALARIPVRTGFVAGAFGTLTKLLGRGAGLNPIVAHTMTQLGKRMSHRSLAEEYYYGSGSKILKTPTSGRPFATPTDEILRKEGLKFSFNYGVDITYLNINDLTPGHAPTAPWGAFEAGATAFINYMSTALNEFPNIEDYIKVRRVSVGK